MTTYTLSVSAEIDLLEIATYGLKRFGLEQSLSYKNALEAHVEYIASQPLAGMSVDDIQTGFRRSVFRSHAIYYRIMDDGIYIVRVLGRQNPATAFNED